MAKEVYKSRVYTDRPAYADFDAPAKFQAITSIVERRLVEHPNAICSCSGGADSDIMIDVIERAKYNWYKAGRLAAEREVKKIIGQLTAAGNRRTE